MSSRENIRVIEAAIEAANAQDWDRYMGYYAENAVFYSTDGGEPREGRNEVRDSDRALASALPDFHLELLRSFSEDDWVCAEYILKGTHQGTLISPDGNEIPATNRTLRIQVCRVYRVENHKVKEVYEYYNQMQQMAQLGLAPEG